MDLPLPPMHPKTNAILEHLGLRVIDVVKWNLLLCREKDSEGTRPTQVLKFGIDPRKSESVDYEMRIMRDVLPMFDESEFDRLTLPEFVGSGDFQGLHWLLTRFIEGEPLVHNWSELNFKPEILGGKGMDEDIAALSVDLLRDLRAVDISVLPKFVRRFKFDEWLEEFKKRSAELVSDGFMEQSAVDAALKLFGDRKIERYEGSMFTNGDFYPRNFVLLPEGKVAVVDWVGGVDPWEFVAMHAWLMMWGNTRWQARYVRELQAHFPIDPEEMQVGLLVKSFDWVWRWREEPEMIIGFARTQMLAYFRQSLDLDYVRHIF